MRISRHQMFMEIAHTVAKRATCFRENVGCIIVTPNGKIISMGYNGAPSGEDHCSYHPNGKCSHSIHAEINALNFVINRKEDDCYLYVTHLPCPNCTKFIILSRMIKHVYFSTIYGDAGLCYRELDNEGITLHRILPSGSITSYNREELYDE